MKLNENNVKNKMVIVKIWPGPSIPILITFLPRKKVIKIRLSFSPGRVSDYNPAYLVYEKNN